MTTSETRYKIPRVMVTHSGVHHADEVFAFALLSLINPNIDVIRVNKVDDIYRSMESIGQAVIVDIGGGEFDHHTDETVEYRDPERELNPYASFGKVLRRFWPYLLETEDEYRMLDSNLALPIDYSDCKGGLWHGVHNYLSDAIASFNPTWEMDSSDASRKAAFLAAAMFAKEIIRNNIAKVKAVKHSTDITEEAIKVKDPKYHFIVLDRYVNYSTTVNQHPDDEIFWVVYPSLRGGWCIYSVIFRGSNIDLISDTIKDQMAEDPAVAFVHPARFIATCDTKENAIEWAKKISQDFDNDPERVRTWRTEIRPLFRVRSEDEDA